MFAYDYWFANVRRYSLSNSGPSRTNLAGTTTVAVEVQTTRVANFLVQKCGLCERELALDTGDVTFGGEWYHAACWLLAEDELRQPKGSKD